MLFSIVPGELRERKDGFALNLVEWFPWHFWVGKVYSRPIAVSVEADSPSFKSFRTAFALSLITYPTSREYPCMQSTGKKHWITDNSVKGR